MIVRALLLALVLAGLVAWERSLVARDASTRVARTETVGRVLPQAEYEALELAAVRLEFGDERPTLTFAPVQGLWRCLEVHQAPADVAALESLIGAVTTAEGYVQSDDPEHAARYGIGGREGVRFSICGPDVLSDPTGDVLWSADLGAGRPGGDGSFLRPGGTAEIWAVDANPRAILARATRPGVPPLVDPTLVGKHWLTASRGVGRVFVDHADGHSFEVATRPVEVTEEEIRAGQPPFEWVLDLASDPTPVPYGRAMAYVFHLQSCEHAGVLDPARARELGYGGPEASRITLFPPEPRPGEEAPQVPPIVLHLLPPLADGSVPAVNPASNALYRLPAETAALLLPRRAELLDGNAPNPWDAALKALQGR